MSAISESSSTDIRDHCHFGVSLRFELLFALHTLFNPHARIHLSWREKALAEMPAAFLELFKTLGASYELWPAVESALPGEQPYFEFGEVIESLSRIETYQLQKSILQGEMHTEEVVNEVVRGELDLCTAISKLPKVNHEWLSFIGLYPYDSSSPIVIAMELLMANPDKFKETVVNALELFWQHSFKSTWNGVKDQFQRSMEERERLFRSCSFEEFAQNALLRIRIDERHGTIEAIRGGFKLAFADIESCYFFPSAFNDRRYWSSYKASPDGKREYTYFPYFDPAITLGGSSSAPQAVVEPELDPALIFKALGDTTRYAIASLLARRSMTAVELSRQLAVSKPTISHHLTQLREAGLINERYQSGAVHITLKKEVFERLSSITVSKLFENPTEAALNLTRRKKMPTQTEMPTQT
jgi:ArsR family transcriptional regulator, arsenate/arsenite/antimonite-responsive transcriptional repressor